MRKKIIATGLIILCVLLLVTLFYVSKQPQKKTPIAPSTPPPIASPPIAQESDELVDKPQESDELAHRAQEILDQMTPDQKAWQMLFVHPEDVIGEIVNTDPAAWAEAFALYPVGGFVISSANMESEESLKSMLSCIKLAGAPQPFIGVDEEGGQVARLSYTLGVTTDFTAMFTYKEQGTGTAYDNAFIIGSEISDFGFNLDFAPVADVWTNAENEVIGKRAYSSDPAEAASLVASAVSGFTSAGVISVLKHFPGHGDTVEDSHDSPAYSYKTLDELRTCEFLPFVSGISENVGMVMMSHVILPEIDPNTPSAQSKIIVGLLRDELGFDGVVITDSMRMNAVSKYNIAACIGAIKAGCDIILAPENPKELVQVITQSITAERLDESVYRILTLKLQWGLIE